jgi:hypothetical protein
MASADWRARVYQELRRQRPARVVVTVDDGDDVKVFKTAGGSDRGRWTRVLQSLPAEWTRIELQDKEEQILWGIDAPGKDDAAGLVQTKSSSVSTELTALLALMLKAQDAALLRQGEMVSKLTASYENLASTLVGRLTSLENLVSTVLQTAYEATLISAEAQAMLTSGGGEKSSQAEKLFGQFMGIKMGARNGAAAGPRPKRPTPTAPAPEE